MPLDDDPLVVVGPVEMDPPPVPPPLDVEEVVGPVETDPPVPT
jgi:hypothetical protein